MYHETINTQHTLKQEILEAFCHTYTRSLNDPNIRYDNVTAMDMITHLNNCFGKIPPCNFEET